MNASEQSMSLKESLKTLSVETNEDSYMLMEYLGPVIDGCKAAMNVSVEDATTIDKMPDSTFEHYMHLADDSFRDLNICFKTIDTSKKYAFVFTGGQSDVYKECTDPEVTIECPEDILIELLDPDSKLLPVNVLGEELKVTGEDPAKIIEALGLLCLPTLLRTARSGVDPTSLLSEDADSVIMAAASDLATKMVKKWIDTRLG
ncbi:MAG: hypothetical protein KGY80_04610 [Candidatus Thorarchaeota archaeon]|nr:hypothetical protein [Candidatus Thorarchaeota archaeon]